MNSFTTLFRNAPKFSANTLKFRKLYGQKWLVYQDESSSINGIICADGEDVEVLNCGLKIAAPSVCIDFSTIIDYRELEAMEYDAAKSWLEWLNAAIERFQEIQADEAEKEAEQSAEEAKAEQEHIDYLNRESRKW